MILTLEQELEALIASEDYRVTIHAGDNYLSLRLIYVPRLRVLGEGGLAYIANGVVAEQHFLIRSPRRRWRKACKWVKSEIEGHRAMLRAIGQA